MHVVGPQVSLDIASFTLDIASIMRGFICHDIEDRGQNSCAEELCELDARLSGFVFLYRSSRALEIPSSQ
jgi:hypothetical protein